MALKRLNKKRDKEKKGKGTAQEKQTSHVSAGVSVVINASTGDVLPTVGCVTCLSSSVPQVIKQSFGI